MMGQRRRAEETEGEKRRRTRWRANAAYWHEHSSYRANELLFKWIMQHLHASCGTSLPLMDDTNLLSRNAHSSIQSKPFLQAESMQMQDRILTATSINKTLFLKVNICLHTESNWGNSWLSLCLYSPSLQARRIEDAAHVLSRQKSSLSLSLKGIASSIWSYLSSALWGRAWRPEGVCLSISFFVHHVWQAVAWDSQELIFKVPLFMTRILRFVKVHSAVSSLAGWSCFNPLQVAVSHECVSLCLISSSRCRGRYLLRKRFWSQWHSVVNYKVDA